MGVRRHLAAAGIATAGDLQRRDAASLALAGRHRELGRLVRRARAAVAGGVLRQVPAEELEAARADVEVDVDMEGYGQATYLWGALVTRRSEVEGIEEGYRSFVDFDHLDDWVEARIFGEFWQWLMGVRNAARSQGASFRVYCFWKAAEEGQMRRAATIGGEGLPSVRELERFFAGGEWVDLHQLAKEQLITEGPLGLKALATLAGFAWRDEDPSGEASMAWYEEARLEGSEAARRRLLEYNEDDVLATRALRDYLGGAARLLPHVEEIGSGS
jgi:predicted RecB family nuclease